MIISADQHCLLERIDRSADDDDNVTFNDARLVTGVTDFSAGDFFRVSCVSKEHLEKQMKGGDQVQ